LAGTGRRPSWTGVRRDAADHERPAVLLCLADIDASGEDIEREQVEAFDLPPSSGTVGDSRSAAFALRHGQLVQVELEALAPEILAGLVRDAVAPLWDTSRSEAVRRAEDADRRRLGELLDALD